MAGLSSKMSFLLPGNALVIMNMTRKEICERIDAIKKDISKNNCELIRKKTAEREYQVFQPNRLRFLGKVIQALRQRLATEVAHVLQWELDKQQEINLRLLEEIETLKRMLHTGANGSGPGSGNDEG
jgi:hypothetical protein